MDQLQVAEPLALLLAAVVGYAIGSVNPAAIIARMRGIDLHSVGSGNPGATNAGRVLGKRTGVIVAILDILKGLVPVLLFSRLGVAAAEVAGFMAVVGHITSPFLKGRGGKGVATTLGAVLGVYPLWIPFVLVGFAVGFLLSRRMGIGAVFGAVVLIGCGIVAPQLDGKIYGIALGGLVLVRHWRNIGAVLRDRQVNPREPLDEDG
ncbi:MAG: glycerol-3-phosphate acyltransferase [Candidatus Nanopelagicales bacterium]